MWLQLKSVMLPPHIRNVRFESEVRDSTLQCETSHNYKNFVERALSVPGQSV